MDKSAIPYLVAGLATVVAALIGAWALLQSRRPSATQTQDGINHGFDAFMAASRERIDDLEARLEQDKRDCDKKLLQLQGQIKALMQWAQSLEALLRRAGIKIPQRPRLTYQDPLETLVHMSDDPPDLRRS